ncbi:IclR family transcriptional regulator [Paenibacillus sp. JMULE4]|uniref:IclR family transcriptional regulator n=1 Tax=Paenibacillus sp. JMULE4 TaxID=2518342 RepID=UPI0015769CD1|nr:IclR family transcriptional regulator [Paenibacillus sp. JMULE4]
MAKQQETLSSVHNALRILRVFTYENPEMGISELSAHLGLAKSTVFRLLCTLSEDHLVEKNKKSQKYHLGLAALELGFAVYHEMELRKVSLPLLERLTKSLRKVVHMGVYDNGEVVYICKLTPDDHLGTITQIGRRVPFHCTSVGKVLLAHQSESEISRLLRNRLTAHTNKTITDPDRLRSCMADVHKKGYAVSHDELKAGVSSVSVPVINDNGEVIAAISAAGSTAHFYDSQVQRYIRELKTCSRIITERLGMQG